MVIESVDRDGPAYMDGRLKKGIFFNSFTELLKWNKIIISECFTLKRNTSE